MTDCVLGSEQLVKLEVFSYQEVPVHIIGSSRHLILYSKNVPFFSV